MSFSKAFLDDLKSRFQLSEVIGRHVKLTRAGREYKGLSPFTNEKTPSFTVNDQKGFYHCFSSGQHGDVIKFLTDVRGLSFYEAVKLLADEAGMALPQQNEEERRWEKKRLGLIDVMEAASQFYAHELNRRPGQQAKAYLTQRGLDEALISDFRMGFAPGDGNALVKELSQKGVSLEQMAEAGLIIQPEDGRSPFDRFRNRVMFPIENARGQVIAFGGRALSADQPAKYLNSPETPLFHKGSVLYNYKRAREICHGASSTQAGRQGGAMIVAEGYMDVIALAKAGLKGAVAPLGTALTEQQIALAWRVSPEPILCFDGDRAGLAAAYRVVDRALPLLKPGHSLRFALMPEGQDPDDVVREHGSAAMAEILEKAQPLADMLWQREMQAGPIDTPERRAGFEERIFKGLGSIENERIRQYYQNDMRQRLRALFAPRQQAKKGGGYAQDWQSYPGRGGKRDRKSPGISPQLRRTALAAGKSLSSEVIEAQAVLTIANHPELLEAHFEAFAALHIKNPKLDRLRNEIIRIAASGEALDRARLDNHLCESGVLEIWQDLQRQKALDSVLFACPEADQALAEMGWQELLTLNRQTEGQARDMSGMGQPLLQELRDAENALSRDLTEGNYQRLLAVKAQLKQMEDEQKRLRSGDQI